MKANVLLIFLVGHSSILAADSSPSIEELTDRWIRWSESVANLPPHRMIYEFHSKAYLEDAGISRQVTTMYRLGNDYNCSEQEKVFVDEPTATQQPFVVSIRTPSQFFSLNRKSESLPWRVANSMAPPAAINIFRPMSNVPKAIRAAREKGQNIGNPKLVQADDGRLIGSFEFSPAITLDFEEQVPMPMSKLDIIFDPKSDFLPVQVDRYLQSDQPFWSRGRATDFVKLGDTSVPSLIEHQFTNDFSKQGFETVWTLRISAIEEVPAEEVTKRCDLAFWELPNLTRPSGFRFSRLLLANLVLLAIFSFWLYRRKQVASEEASGGSK
jgi:hypothetical protein